MPGAGNANTIKAALEAANLDLNAPLNHDVLKGIFTGTGMSGDQFEDLYRVAVPSYAQFVDWVCQSSPGQDGIMCMQENQRLRLQMQDLQKKSKQGGIGWAPAVEENSDKIGLQGLLVKVNHISLIVADEAKSREFYCDFMGCKPINRPAFPCPGAWLWLGNVQLHLIQNKEAAAIESAHAAGVGTGCVNHTSFEVHDFAAVEAKLKKLKYPYKKNRVPEHGQVIQQLFLTDPDGHYIEICDCNKFTDLVLGPPLNPEEARKLASEYLEGVDPCGATVAAVAALAFVPGKFQAGSKEELEESLGMLQRAFCHFAGGDNAISKDDFGKILRRMGQNVTDQEARQLVEELDTDKSGSIKFKEFAKYMGPKLKPHHSNEELIEAFNTIDRDDSGFINSEELLLMLWGIGQRMDEEKLAAAIRKADTNGDKKVNFKEFLTLFESLQ
jgi:Ca2+-binding EF-hand superfamily protein/catechol 2,3-dioxygenase-like lactoylglutathione lyase family enzyme